MGQAAEPQLCGQRGMSSCALGLSVLNPAVELGTQSGLAALVTHVVLASMQLMWLESKWYKYDSISPKHLSSYMHVISATVQLLQRY